MADTFRADLIYAASHCLKTTQIGLAVEWQWKTKGLKSRLWSADGGGTDPLSILIQEGTLEVQTLNPDEPALIEKLNQASLGWWPDDKGKMQPPNPKERFAITAFEGVYSLGEIMMERFRHKGLKLAQDPSFSYQDGNSVFYGGNMTYYGEAQNRLHDMIRNSHTITNSDRVIWTSLEDTDDEKGKSRLEGGPTGPGNKLVTKMAQWFRNTFHIVRENGELVMYLKRHANKMGTEFAAGVRVPFQYADQFPATIKPPNVVKFYEQFESLTNLHAAQTSPTQIQPTGA